MDKPVKANLFMLCFMVYNGLLPIAIAVLIKLIPGVDYDMFEKYITLFQHFQYVKKRKVDFGTLPIFLHLGKHILTYRNKQKVLFFWEDCDIIG